MRVVRALIEEIDLERPPPPDSEDQGPIRQGGEFWEEEERE